MRAKEEAKGMVIDRQKRILHFQYDEVSKEINIMEKKMEDMKKKMEDINNDVTYLKQVRDKVGHNLELLGLQVENVRNKEKQAKPSQQVQTEITAEDIFLRTEDEIAANTLIDIHHQSQIQSVEEVDTNVQQCKKQTSEQTF